MRTFAVPRGGLMCGGKPCWKTKGGIKGYTYGDKAMSANGVKSITYVAGDAGKGYVSVAGANNAGQGQTALPTGVAAALAGQTHPTLQVVTGFGFCVGTTLNDVVDDDGLRFRARQP